MAGAISFLLGVGFLLALAAVSESTPEEKLFALNVAMGGAIVYMALGGWLAVQAASGLGGTPSGPMPLRWPWFLLPLFPVCVGVGQVMALHPGRLPWLFPIVNVAMVSIPSLSIAALVAWRYRRANPLAWPMSWREWTSAFIYGAVGATTIAGIVNTLYLYGAAEWLVHREGLGGLPLEDAIRGLPRGWGSFLDLSALSFVAPLNEESWKSFIVALFFFRRGGPARCFAWGALAGSGFNLLETFVNSLGAVSPDALADATINSQWWLFATARGGTAAMHGLATGMAALGMYGVLRRKPRYIPGLPAGMLLHGTWNFLVWVVVGDAIFSGAGPDSRLLDALGFGGMLVLAAMSFALLWYFSGALRDERPAAIYQLLGMAPKAIPASQPDPVLASEAV